MELEVEATLPVPRLGGESDCATPIRLACKKHGDEGGASTRWICRKGIKHASSAWPHCVKVYTGLCKGMLRALCRHCCGVGVTDVHRGMPSALCVILYIISGPYRPLQGNAPRSLQTLFMNLAAALHCLVHTIMFHGVNQLCDRFPAHMPAVAGTWWANAPSELAKIGQANN